MIRRHALISAILTGLCALCQTPASAQSTTQQIPQRQIESVIPPEYKPDLMITSMNITTVCTAQGTVTANIAATIKNQSAKGTADLSKIPWHIIAEAMWWPAYSVTYLENQSKTTIKPQVGGPTTLKPGQTWNAKLTILGIPKYKTNLGNAAPIIYHFEVKIDPLNGVAESNEGNNKWMKTAPDACFKP